jgi:hypothetical protein
MAAPVAARALAAPAEWTLLQVIQYWMFGEVEEEDEEKESEQEAGHVEDAEDEDEDHEDDKQEEEAQKGFKCYLGVFEEAQQEYLQKLREMGVTTRLQAQAVLTDDLCRTLDAPCSVSCDSRRELLDLLGVNWRKQVCSSAEMSVWRHKQVDPEASHGNASSEEKGAFTEMMIQLGLASFLNIFHTNQDGSKYGLLSKPTARNLLYYLGDADFERAGIPTRVRQAMRTEALRRVNATAKSSQEMLVCACVGLCKCKGKIEKCISGSREKLANGRWYVFVESELDTKASCEELPGQGSLRGFRVQVQELREYLSENGNEYPKQHTKFSCNATSCMHSTFVNKQRVLFKKAKLDEDRVRLLKTLPGWTFNPRSQAWSQMYEAASKQLQKSRELLGCDEKFQYPRKSSLMPVERKIGQWLANQRQDFLSGEPMPTERKALLQKLPCWARFLQQSEASKRQLGGSVKEPSKRRRRSKRPSTSHRLADHSKEEADNQVGVASETDMMAAGNCASAVFVGKRLRRKTPMP